MEITLFYLQGNDHLILLTSQIIFLGFWVGVRVRVRVSNEGRLSERRTFGIEREYDYELVSEQCEH
jgi:hypothetical protein